MLLCSWATVPMFRVLDKGKITEVGRRLDVQMKLVAFEDAAMKFDWRFVGPVRPAG